MLKNAALDAKIGVDTAENEPSKVLAEKSEKSSVSNFSSKHRSYAHWATITWFAELHVVPGKVVDRRSRISHLLTETGVSCPELVFELRPTSLGPYWLLGAGFATSSAFGHGRPCACARKQIHGQLREYRAAFPKVCLGRGRAGRV